MEEQQTDPHVLKNQGHFVTEDSDVGFSFYFIHGQLNYLPQYCILDYQ